MEVDGIHIISSSRAQVSLLIQRFRMLTTGDACVFVCFLPVMMYKCMEFR